MNKKPASLPSKCIKIETMVGSVLKGIVSPPASVTSLNSTKAAKIYNSLRRVVNDLGEPCFSKRNTANRQIAYYVPLTSKQKGTQLDTSKGELTPCPNPCMDCSDVSNGGSWQLWLQHSLMILKIPVLSEALSLRCLLRLSSQAAFSHSRKLTIKALSTICVHHLTHREGKTSPNYKTKDHSN